MYIRVYFRLCAAALCTALLGTLPAPALTTYTYSGAPYSTVVDEMEMAPGGKFTTNMAASASIVLANPLAANSSVHLLSWTYDGYGNGSGTFSENFVSATLSNGLDIFSFSRTFSTYPSIPPIAGANYARLFLSTDSIGDIIGWSLSAGTIGHRYNLPYGWVSSGPLLNAAGHSLDPFPERTASGSGGIWSIMDVPVASVPLPSGILLLASALFLLGRLRSTPRS